MNSNTEEILGLAKRGQISKLATKLTSQSIQEAIIAELDEIIDRAFEKLPNGDSESAILYAIAQAFDRAGVVDKAEYYYHVSADLTEELLTTGNHETGGGGLATLILCKERLGDIMMDYHRFTDARIEYESAIAYSLLMASDEQPASFLDKIESICTKTADVCRHLGDGESAALWDNITKRVR